uniref:Gamma-aminobutyric acid receptor-associated protein-like 2 n=1 Tax=Gallus gallus TaxID=9031 RepID=F1NNM2_CHICK
MPGSYPGQGRWWPRKAARTGTGPWAALGTRSASARNLRAETARGLNAAPGRAPRGWELLTVAPVGHQQRRHVEHRCVESAKIRAKYPDRVPVIVEKVSGSQIVDIDKRKYLVPSDITVAQFMWIIRKRIQLPSEKAIFLFVDKTVPQSSLTMGQLYEKEKDEDGFLYVAYSGENTFGF